ncbi:MAG: gamma-glutamyl-gamma-aminobutyrate hydrolase family protein [Bacteroidales bacterium]|nr:gamma-glutamyl-gamma-aminobutyrate hydrolase family protein [Bacteroidales bacterium]
MRKRLLNGWMLSMLAVCVAMLFASCNGNNAKRASVSDEVVIGIAWRADTTSEFYTNVRRAIEEAGATPVLLDMVMPDGYTHGDGKLADEYVDENGVLREEYASEVKGLAAELSNVADVVSGVSAVVFTGGEDIAPTLLRCPEPWHGIEAERDYNATRDVSDYLTMAYCLNHDMPVLGMCRGMQMLSVVSGATIVQDIPAFYASRGIEYAFLHRNPCEAGQYRDYSSHIVLATRGTLLHKIAGTDSIVGAPSWHHQCVGSIEGTSLTVDGLTSTQGIDIIEAVERKDKTFCLGLQFHPEAAVVKHLDGAANESQFMTYDDAMRYFKELVQQARDYAKRQK